MDASQINNKFVSYHGFFSITFSASATPNTGQLYKICKSGAIDKPSKTYCLAFILGVYDGLLNNFKHELSIKKNKDKSYRHQLL